VAARVEQRAATRKPSGRSRQGVILQLQSTLSRTFSSRSHFSGRESRSHALRFRVIVLIIGDPFNQTRIMNDDFILLAEDSEADVYLARLALRDYGLNQNIHVISDGEEALLFIDRLENEPGFPSLALMLLDLHLPKRDGLEVLARLRAGSRGRQIPVIVLTSSESPEIRATAEAYERVHFFKKASSVLEFMRLGAISRDIMSQRAENAAIANGSSGK